MKITALILAFLTLSMVNIKANEEDRKILGTVSEMFAALGAEDLATFHSVTSPDFYIFDAGTRFDGDSVVGFIKSLHAKGKRFYWQVTKPDIHVEGNTAWISYVNKGSITDLTGTSSQDWLESGFLHKRDGKWEIVFMHSTRIPKEIKVQESERRP